MKRPKPTALDQLSIRYNKVIFVLVTTPSVSSCRHFNRAKTIDARNKEMLECNL